MGAGQAGLQLALGLLAADYEVTLVADRSPDEVRQGQVTSTQIMFHTALDQERELGLNHWEDQTPPIEGLGITVATPDGVRRADWMGRLDHYAQSVDQRVKMAGWMEEFTERGGHLVLRAAGVADLEALSRGHDLVVVATGKGELSTLFARDPLHSPFLTPQRALSAAYVHGLGPRLDHDRPGLSASFVAGVGALFVLPSYTTSGPCGALLWEAVPGGPADVFAGVRDPGERLRLILELVERHTPWEHARTAKVELTDERATLTGGYPPVVRHPVAELPSGALVLGAGDVLVLADPAGAQGANSAAKCATAYLRSIVEHGDGPFDREFMERTFARYWDTAGAAITRFTNTMLAPLPEHVQRMFMVANEYPEVADRFVNAFDDPSLLRDWFYQPEEMARYLDDVRMRGGAGAGA